MNRKILFLGTAGFPYGMAEVSKQTLIARALQEEGCKVTFVCTNCFSNLGIPFKGSYKNIDYIYLNLFTRKLPNKILHYLFAKMGEFFELLYLQFARYDYAMANARDYYKIRRYATLIHLRNKKIFLTHTEDLRSLYENPNKKLEKQITLFETKTWKLIDGVFPISEELIRQVKSQNPTLPCLKIPVLVDVKEANIENYSTVKGNYYLFAGAANYYSTVEFIIAGFEKTKNNDRLILIVSGSEKDREKMQDRVNQSESKQRIIVTNYVPKQELWALYKSADALVIPLNFNQQDKVRFPHKIGEYCASKVPIITSNWGEIPYYFTNKGNAILLESDKPEELAKAFEFVSENQELCRKIAAESYKLAINEFNYRNYGSKILTFMINA